MNLSELFNDVIRKDHGVEYWSPFYSYWGIEFSIAQSNGHMYSCLEEYQNQEQRTCGLCGTVCNTRYYEYSEATPDCENEICNSVRDFWGFTNFKNPLPTHGGKNARSAWFRRVMIEQFGVGQIYKIPEELRLDAAIAMQLMRIAKEAKNE